MPRRKEAVSFARRNRKNRKLSCRCLSWESFESRLMLSVSTPVPPVGTAIPNPIVVLKSHMTSPEGYSSPNGAPITPAKMRSAYGLGTYGASNVTFNGVQGDGTGQTIALVEGGSDPNIISDLSAFDAYWSLPNPPSIQQLNATGGTSLPSAGDVDELALDVEWTHVMAPGASLLIFDGNLYTAIKTAASTPGVSAISISYGISGTEGISEFETPAGHAGVTFLASTGDTGGTVVDPAKSPAVVAVGGTDLYLSGNSYSSETAWSDGGGGINTGESQPSYQKGVVSAFSTTDRTTPDVSMDADPSTGVAVYDTYSNGTSAPWSAIVGGTSLSSPLMAGLIAVADQGRTLAGLSTLDGYTQTLPRLYSLYTDSYAKNFHDITTGNNTHAAGVGYDLASGIGSPIANYLVPDLAGADTITGRVFTDVTGNGVYGGADTPLANKTVYLDLGDTGVQTANDPTAVTNSSGVYTFSDQLGSLTGVVRLAASSLPAGYVHSTPLTSFTTSYDQTQTINIGLFPESVAIASPASVTTTTASLSVTGAMPANAAGFLYTWRVASEPAGASAVFSPNGTSAAQNSTVTFNKAGSYTLTLSISDGEGSTVSVNSSTITVSQAVTSVAVSPTTASVLDAGSRQLSALAYDQFGNALSPEPTFSWSIDSGGAGSVSASGLYTAPVANGGIATVRASASGVSGTSAITVIPTIIDGTSGNDTIRIVRSGANLLMYINSSTAPTYNVSYAAMTSLTIASGAGSDIVAIDFSAGVPVPAGGLTVNSGVTTGNSAANNDSLVITGTTGNDSATVNASSINFNGSVVNYANINSITLNGNGGADALTQAAQPGNNATLVFNGTTSGGPSTSDSLNITAGSFAFAAPASGSGINPIWLASLNVGSGAIVSVGTAPADSDRWVLNLSGLDVSGGTLDLGGNDMIVHGGSLSALWPQVASAAAGGFWTGPGITSTLAANDSAHLTALGIISSPANTSFDHQTVSTGDILVKYTYVGDITLDGTVDGSAYSKLDYGYLTGLTGWGNGDLNYDGHVDGSDYTLMDNAFNTQGASLADAVATSQIATPQIAAAQIATSQAPTPASFSPSFTSPSTQQSPFAQTRSSFWKWYDGSQ
jgi:hypothetical protein